jgi:NhaP-type Na+/H+ or K+/H+ antiporter
MLRASKQNAVLVTPAVVFAWLGLAYPAYRIELWIPAAILFSGALANLVRVVRKNRRSFGRP